MLEQNRATDRILSNYCRDSSAHLLGVEGMHENLMVESIPAPRSRRFVNLEDSTAVFMLEKKNMVPVTRTQLSRCMRRCPTLHRKKASKLLAFCKAVFHQPASTATSTQEPADCRPGCDR